MTRRFARTALCTSIALALSAPAHAALERVGPIDPSPTVGGFPAWFQDKTGLAIEFCDLKNMAELNGGWCTLIPPTPSAAPETFPSPFFVEHFYWNGVATATAGTARAKLVLAMEASFANGTVVQPGDQVVFGRVRVDINPVPYSGTYVVYHPYGKLIFPNVVGGSRLRMTQDIGLSCVGTFTCALNTEVGPFLLPSATPGGAEVPPIPDLQAGQDPFYDILVNTGGQTPYPGTGKKYIADPARIGAVTGSPLAPFVGNDGVTYDHNVFRVEGPNGFLIHQDQFSLNGRVMTGPLPSQVSPARATYTDPAPASPSGKKLDVFALGQPTAQGRIPGQPRPGGLTMPSLTFFEAACTGTLDPVTDKLLPPYGPPVGAPQVQMGNAGSNYWGQSHPATIPAEVCLEDASARNAAGQVVPQYYLMPVTDEVSITTGATAGAFFDPSNGGTLTVTAGSSDKAFPAALSVAGFGPVTNGVATISPLSAPPSKVTVISTEGGSSELIVSTGVGSATAVVAPSANNDNVTMFEDCSATTALSCASPLVLRPLDNDTFNGGPIPAGATITIVQAPGLGTAVVNADNTIRYTPRANVNGTDTFMYNVQVDGITSNIATVRIDITPVNDAPQAVNDTLGGRVGVANSFNLIANDLDLDGATDLADAQIVSWAPQLGTQPVPAAGVVSFTPTQTGTFTFTYRAVDKAGAVSANTATVTVNVAAAEAILVAKSLYLPGKKGGSSRWTVQGTDSVFQGQVLSIVYTNGTFTAAAGGGSCNGSGTNPKCVVGTAVVDSLGNSLYDQVLPLGGPSDPTDTATWASAPTTVRVFSSSPVLGGSQTSVITFR